MRYAIATLLTGAFLMPAGAGADKPEVSKYAKVFKSAGAAQDLTVTMVRIGPKKKNEHIIRFSGIDSKFDGKIIKHDCREWGMNRDKIDCCTKDIRNGSRYCAFIGRGGWFGQFFEAVLPDMKTTRCYFDKKASKKVKTGEFLDKYLAQKKSTKRK